MIVDLFAGPGGWDVGASLAGIAAPVGLEWEEGACNTRAAAGHLTIRADVAAYPVEAFAGVEVDGLIASPPCQEFSIANSKRDGVDSVRGALVWEVMRWAEALRPGWIACEQVPPVLPIWRHFAHLLRELGYDARAAVLCAADYGVPQKRYRSILLARRGGPARWPVPTHDEHGSMFTERWVTMAEALGWGYVHRPSGTVVGQSDLGGRRGLDGGSGARRAIREAVADGRFVLQANYTTHEMDAEGKRRTLATFSLDRPAPTLTGKAAEWELVDTRRDQRPDGSTQTFDPNADPAVTVTGKSAGQWVYRHPATTVMSDARIRPPGWHKERQPPGTIRVTNAELGVLQGFPADYPWRGPRIGQQIGNAVPPPLAAAILSAVTA